MRGKIIAPDTQTAPSFEETFKTFAKIGLLSFGGPTAQIALMHRILVDEKKWIDEERYLSALSFCMFLPGPEAMQLATYVGWRLHGLKGGLAAGLLFVLPGATLVLALAMAYGAYGNVPIMAALFLGIKAAVLVIVLDALLRIARRALKQSAHWFIAALSFVGIFFFNVPFPLIVLAAALYGYVTTPTPQKTQSIELPPGLLLHTARTVTVWSMLWLAPLVAIAAEFGTDHVLSQLSLFFSKLAIVTFGGAYAVLAYMAQDVVNYYEWLDAGAMMDGLGLAETTPGPLILVTEIRRLSGCLPPRRRANGRHGVTRRLCSPMGDIRSVLPLDLRRSTLSRMDRRPTQAQKCSNSDHRCRSRRHPQSCRLVCSARDVQGRHIDQAWATDTLASDTVHLRSAGCGYRAIVGLPSSVPALEHSNGAWLRRVERTVPCLASINVSSTTRLSRNIANIRFRLPPNITPTETNSSNYGIARAVDRSSFLPPRSTKNFLCTKGKTPPFHELALLKTRA